MPVGSLKGSGGSTRRSESRSDLEARRRRTARLLLAPAIATLLLVGVGPFLYAIWISLHDTQFFELNEFSWFANYREVVSDGAFLQSLLRTFVIMAIAVPIEFALALLAASWFNRGVYGERVLSPAFLLPSVVSPTVVAITWKVMLAGSWGFLTYHVVDRFGLLEGSSVFSDSTAAFLAIIGIDIWQWTPFLALALHAGLASQPRSPHNAAAVDGASDFTIFRLVTLPMLIPLIAVLGVLRVIDTMKIFDTVFVATAGGPGESTTIVSYLLYEESLLFFKLGTATAAAVLIMLVLFQITSILFKLLNSRIGL